jgi:hypothetical protein
MKNFLIIGMAGIILTACGTDNQSTSNLQNTDGIFKRAAVINEIIKVEPINAGINPSEAAFEVQGKVMIGSNRCQARGVKLAVEQTVKNDKLFVTVYTLKPSNIFARNCTREFMPQYAMFTEQVRYDAMRISDVVLKNYQAEGQDVSYTMFLNGGEQTESVISGVNVDVINGGINPSYKALSITGNVGLGTNPCFASGVTAQLTQQVVGNTLYVVAVTTTPADHINRICTLEYNPIATKVETTVHFDTTVIEKVIIKNVDQHGQEVSAFELIGIDG